MKRSRTALGAFFIAAGINHFVNPRPYRRTVPPGFGEPVLVVRVSGVAEIAGGVAALVPATRQLAGWWLVALLAAIFPANIYSALCPREAGAGKLPRWALWARLPLQPLMMRWALRATR